MAERSVLIRVPSTVGNFGGAVNSAAMALEAPLNVKVTPRLDGHVGIRYFGDNGERVPRDRSNLVVRTFEAALHFKGVERADHKRSEEHTSELQSPCNLVCRLLLEKKKRAQRSKILRDEW